MKMKILADDALPLVVECFSSLGEVTTKAGRLICKQDLLDVDVLLVRSRTKINADLLDGTPVKFVGSGVIGLDHVDQDYLKNRGIYFASAQGCNAVSVSEYITASLLHIATQKNITLAGKTIGIIGVGNVGKNVLKKALALGLKPLCCDPPRQRQEEGDFVDLTTAMQADIITVHTPLTDVGKDKTKGMITAQIIEQLNDKTIFINAARGGIVDEDALITANLQAKVIDCWVNEPDISLDLLATADIATPHIAGHSYEGKLNGTTMLYTSLCKFLNCDLNYNINDVLPIVEPNNICVETNKKTVQDVLNTVIQQCYNIMADDKRFRLLPNTNPDKSTTFENQRRTYPMRRQWDMINLDISDNQLKDIFKHLGFKVNDK